MILQKIPNKEMGTIFSTFRDAICIIVGLTLYANTKFSDALM